MQNAITSTVRLRYTVDGWLYRSPAPSRQLFETLRNKVGGKPVLVVGNGPSLNQTPLEAFGGVPAIGMNKIDLIYPRTQWRPSLIVCVNNLVVRQHQQRFAQSEVPVFLAWKSRWFMRASGALNVHYFKNQPTAQFSQDVSVGVAGLSSTVTYAALQFAYFMGADPVILLGVDHSFSVVEERAGIARRSGEDPNHFDPDYFKEGDYWGLPDLPGSEVDYDAARQAFAADGRRILDATVGGQLQIFPKISIQQALDLVHSHAHS